MSSRIFDDDSSYTLLISKGDEDAIEDSDEEVFAESRLQEAAAILWGNYPGPDAGHA